MKIFDLYIHKKPMKHILRVALWATDIDDAIAKLNEEHRYAFFTKEDICNLHEFDSMEQLEKFKKQLVK